MGFLKLVGKTAVASWLGFQLGYAFHKGLETAHAEMERRGGSGRPISLPSEIDPRLIPGLGKVRMTPESLRPLIALRDDLVQLWHEIGSAPDRETAEAALRNFFKQRNGGSNDETTPGMGDALRAPRAEGARG